MVSIVAILAWFHVNSWTAADADAEEIERLSLPYVFKPHGRVSKMPDRVAHEQDSERVSAPGDSPRSKLVPTAVCQSSETATALVKSDPPEAGASRYHTWKCQVSAGHQSEYACVAHRCPTPDVRRSIGLGVPPLKGENVVPLAL